MAQGFIRTAILSGILVAFAPGIALGGDPIPQKGTTPYVTHFIFRPLVSLDVPGFKATAFEATGTTENMKGEKMLDKMAARCVAINIDTGPKTYIDGACVLADSDGDKIFSTFIFSVVPVEATVSHVLPIEGRWVRPGG